MMPVCAIRHLRRIETKVNHDAADEITAHHRETVKWQVVPHSLLVDVDDHLGYLL